ncbi:hypothetical protein VP01_1790g1 [Puccinia sorghi]|uniref:Uncharacterized protein n=1 Tax=Puccinia sorghi TaxID=27349 RepID=A0A0L6VGD5_9BASI|nr:hypothetical protein VP01_1790g1 [Puccinia sorghi]
MRWICPSYECCKFLKRAERVNFFPHGTPIQAKNFFHICQRFGAQTNGKWPKNASLHYTTLLLPLKLQHWYSSPYCNDNLSQHLNLTVIKKHTHHFPCHYLSMRQLEPQYIFSIIDFKLIIWLDGHFRIDFSVSFLHKAHNSILINYISIYHNILIIFIPMLKNLTQPSLSKSLTHSILLLLTFHYPLFFPQAHELTLFLSIVLSSLLFFPSFCWNFHSLTFSSPFSCHSFLLSGQDFFPIQNALYMPPKTWPLLISLDLTASLSTSAPSTESFGPLVRPSLFLHRTMRLSIGYFFIQFFSFLFLLNFLISFFYILVASFRQSITIQNYFISLSCIKVQPEKHSQIHAVTQQNLNCIVDCMYKDSNLKPPIHFEPHTRNKTRTTQSLSNPESSLCLVISQSSSLFILLFSLSLHSLVLEPPLLLPCFFPLSSSSCCLPVAFYNQKLTYFSTQRALINYSKGLELDSILTKTLYLNCLRLNYTHVPSFFSLKQNSRVIICFLLTLVLYCCISSSELLQLVWLNLIMLKTHNHQVFFSKIPQTLSHFNKSMLQSFWKHEPLCQGKKSISPLLDFLPVKLISSSQPFCFCPDITCHSVTMILLYSTPRIYALSLPMSKFNFRSTRQLSTKMFLASLCENTQSIDCRNISFFNDATARKAQFLLLVLSLLDSSGNKKGQSGSNLLIEYAFRVVMQPISHRIKPTLWGVHFGLDTPFPWENISPTIVNILFSQKDWSKRCSHRPPPAKASRVFW